MARHARTRLTDPFGPHRGSRIDIERDAGNYAGRHCLDDIEMCALEFRIVRGIEFARGRQGDDR